MKRVLFVVSIINKGEFRACRSGTFQNIHELYFSNSKQGSHRNFEARSLSVLRYTKWNLGIFFSAALVFWLQTKLFGLFQLSVVAVGPSSPHAIRNWEDISPFVANKNICRLSRRSLALPARLRWDSLSRSIVSASPSTSLGSHG